MHSRVLKWKRFTGDFSTWPKLMDDAARFATELGPERVLSVSQSDSFLTVWYWSEPGEGGQLSVTTTGGELTSAE